MRRRTVLITVMVLLMALPVIASAAPPAASTIDLPRTGQTTCYDASGGTTTCPGTGQDGEIQAGVAWPSPRFADNGDGTVTDNLTGLIWLTDANCIKTQYSTFDTDDTAGDGRVTWQHALDFVAGINDGTYSNCGAEYTDWRLPNVNELESLINAEEANSATWLNGQGFSNVQSTSYWSSTTYAGYTDHARLVNMDDSYVYAYDKTSNFYVWPVRGTTTNPAELWKTGQTTCYDASGGTITCSGTGQDGDIQAGVDWSPSTRFTNNGDGTVTDNLTGLVWLTDANCINTQYSTFDTDDTAGDGAVTWQHALDFVTGINDGTYSNCGAGYTDWRLPNRKEMRSLIDYSQYNPALPSGHPFSNVQSDYYWSSTTFAFNTFYAWSVYMNNGNMNDSNKTYDFIYVWPVRAGTIQHTVTPSVGTGQGSISPNTPQTVNHGDTVQFTLTPAQDYHIDSVGGTCIGKLNGNIFNTDPITSDCTVVANFAINQYTVTPSAGAHGSISPSTPQTVNHGATATFTVTPDTGYTATVTGTCGGSLAGNTYTTDPITADCTVQANFTLNQYNITATANPTAGGSVTCSPNPVDHDLTSTCTITTNTGYTLQDVTGTCGGTLNGNTYTTNAITQDCTVVANFTLNNPVTIPSATGRGDITLETGTPGCGFYDYSAKTEADVANDPNYDYPYGLVEFRVNCPSADVTVTFPGDVSGLPYRKYGPTTPGDSGTTKWYEFTDTTRSGNQVTLHLQDGVLGDDTAVDGIIVDQGGPGQPPEEVAVPTMTEWGMMIFIFLAGLGSVYYLRRRA